MDQKVTKLYRMEHLGCANCAAKMEAQIRELPEIQDATLTFATKQLRVTANPGAEMEQLFQRIKQICAHIESDVTISEAVLDTRAGSVTEAASKSDLASLGPALFGLVLYLFTLFSGFVPASWELWLYIVSYILFGYDIIKGAVINMRHGEIFDEKFLMLIATVGAFAIGEYAEAVGVMLFNRVGETLEDKAVERSRSQIMAAVDLRPPTVRRVCLTDGDIDEIPAGQAEVGDILIVRPGDRIPLDGIIDEGESLLDMSALTGEPVPVTCRPGDAVLSGGVNTTSVLRLRVTKVLEESMVSKILQSVEDAASQKPQIDRFITRFARVYTPAVVAIASATAIIPSLYTGQWYHWIYIALTFLVISCPCALVLSVPLSFFAGVGAASRVGILFKSGLALEKLNRIRTAVFDKTGTVTKGTFTVQEISAVSPEKDATLLQICASAEMDSVHPIAQSVVSAAQERHLSLTRPQSVQEYAGEGIAADVNGAVILCGNGRLFQRFNIVVPAEAAAYGTELLVACDGIYMGRIVIADTIKVDAAAAVERLHSRKITTAMLTGDSRQAAAYIAKETGIDEVRARLLPQDKVGELVQLRQQYGPVLFVGDGINDAPVLAGADVGAAMGSGADAAVEAADVVFMHSQMSAVPQAFALAHCTMDIAWQNIIFALVVKGLVIIAGFLGYASLWAAVFADTGVAALCVLNSVRILFKKI
jgi:Cd2+/Zn2+-exporting ATPase